MSVPRRQTPPFARVWSYQRPAGVLILVAMLTGWAAAQGVMWWLDIDSMRNGLLLDATGIRAGEYWRFVSYQVVHSGALHFFATMLALYFAGREVEPIIGRRHVIGLFLTANLIGGAVAWSVEPVIGIHGGSAGAAAMLAAYATILPELEHRFRLFWLVPVRFHTRHAVLLLLLAAGWCVHARGLQEVGPAGVITGAVLGWFWARLLGFGRLLWFQRAACDRDAIERRRERMSAEEFISAEVDPILEKIARSGLRSLTRAERRLLDLAKEKIEAKRG
jgi:membrane associated rhomboid family serine protease